MRFQFPGVVVLAVFSGIASDRLLAMGSVEGAAGGIELLLLFAAGLLGLSIAVLGSGLRPAESPSTRDA